MGLDLNKGTLLSSLRDLKDKIKLCLIKNGINPKSFDFCCGEKYSNIEHIFEGKYRELKVELLNSFSKNILKSCQFNKKPCYELIQTMDEAIHNNEEIYDAMLQKKEEVLTGKAVNRELLEMEYGRLKNNYNTFLNSKELVV